MANAYKTPGVYVEEIPNLPPSVAGVETAIPAFIGYTQKAAIKSIDDALNTATRITSMVEYEAYFGVAEPETTIVVTVSKAADGTRSAVAQLDETKRSKHMMWYALRLYFDNGGGPCYILSVGGYGAIAVKALKDGLALIGKVDEPTLIVFPEAQYLSDIGDYKDLHDEALQQCALLQDRLVIMDLHSGDAGSMNDSSTDIGKAVGKFRDSGSVTTNLKYGAVYAPNIQTSIDFNYDPAKTNVHNDDGNDYFVSALQAKDDQAYNLVTAAISALPCNLPPAGAIAGVYAAVDSARGVWKAPANVSVSDANQPTIPITNVDQDGMNVDPTAGKSVNAIRAFTGLGTLVWGARTLAGNDNEWRYINVRRFCIFAEESIRKACQQFVFEPNDGNTWVKVQGMIENFLNTQWRQGALMGSKPADAYSVSIGLGKTMTALDVLEGRMIVVVGLCPVRPAEFIVLRFVQTMPVS